MNISQTQMISLAAEIFTQRHKAHVKHGDKSIEAKDVSFDRLMSILTEEVGEVAMAINNSIVKEWGDEETLWNVRKELIDVLTVASAWVARIDEISPLKMS